MLGIVKGKKDVLVNDVYDTVGDQHVGCDDLSAVDEDIATVNGYGEVHAIHGRDRFVLES